MCRFTDFPAILMYDITIARLAKQTPKQGGMYWQEFKATNRCFWFDGLRDTSGVSSFAQTRNISLYTICTHAPNLPLPILLEVWLLSWGSVRTLLSITGAEHVETKAFGRDGVALLKVIDRLKEAATGLRGHPWPLLLVLQTIFLISTSLHFLHDKM